MPMMPIPAMTNAPPTTAPVETTVSWERVERFVGQVAHDLRNGLNACELQLTFLAEISSDPEAVDEVKRLRGTVSDMTKQLQNLRTATGNVTAHVMDYPAADLFEDLRERFEKLHPDQKARVQWKATVGPETTAVVDPEITMNAGLELLRNALHFAPKEGEVACSLEAVGDRVVLGVEQPLEEPPSLPPETWGATPLQSTRRGAYGLGLFRARRGIEAQAGTLRFQYAPERQTVSAQIALPLSGAA